MSPMCEAFERFPFLGRIYQGARSTPLPSLSVNIRVGLPKFAEIQARNV